jgi:hypothetical protein
MPAASKMRLLPAYRPRLCSDSISSGAMDEKVLGTHPFLLHNIQDQSGRRSDFTSSGLRLIATYNRNCSLHSEITDKTAALEPRFGASTSPPLGVSEQLFPVLGRISYSMNRDPNARSSQRQCQLEFAAPGGRLSALFHIGTIHQSQAAKPRLANASGLNAFTDPRCKARETAPWARRRRDSRRTL